MARGADMPESPLTHPRLPGAPSLPARDTVGTDQASPPTNTTSHFSPVASAEYDTALAWEAGVAAVIP